MTVSSFCESRNGPYTNFRHAILDAAFGASEYDAAGGAGALGDAGLVMV